MPNSISASGLTTATREELVAQYTAAFQAIYGSDINLDQDSPDGQLMMIFIQTCLDNLDLMTQIYNGFDPDKAFGVVLDSRVAYNGIQRLDGTYTVTNVTITTDRALTLVGLDDPEEDEPYTVSDNAGTQWVLINTESPVSSGSYVYAFRAKNPGATLTTVNTITTPITIVLGVTAINNPTTYTTLGTNEETDAELKVRRQKSVTLASQGYLAGLVAALESTEGVTDAIVRENVTSTTDGDGIPGHSIWVIVDGSATDLDIATAIYRKRNAGAGMYGAVSYFIDQVDGTTFEIKWDVVTSQNLFIKFTATSLDGVNSPDIAAIRSGLPTSFVTTINGQVNINDLATLVQEIDNNTLVTSAGFSLTSGGVYTNTLSPSTKDKRFSISSANIIIIPMLMSPPSASVASGGATQQFTALGGYGAYTYTIFSGAGSVNSSTGLFTSAGTGSTVVRATDTQGNTADATVTVT